jgi:hypothetical protein
LKRKRTADQKEQTFHHNVYVILLGDAVAEHPSILRLNPKRDPLKPCVYVGMTGIPVDHRFENHKYGYKSAWVVRKYGVRLMPELYEHLNPMPFEAAVQMELELTEELRAAGYTVTAGTLQTDRLALGTSVETTQRFSAAHRCRERLPSLTLQPRIPMTASI